MVVSCGALLAVGAAPAAAKVAHQPEGSFNGSDTPEGTLGDVLAISVDNSTGPSAGDVYVGGFNPENGISYAYKFDAEGHYVGVELKGSETPAGSFAMLSFNTFTASRGLAVDSSGGANNGDVYLADAEHQVIDRFSESGAFLCQISGREYASLSSAEQAAECAGSAGSETPQGGFTEGSFFEAAFSVAVNPVNGDVYVSDPGHAVIDEFNEAGEYVGQISDSHLTMPGSIALNSSGELYVYNGSLLGGENVVKFDAGGSFASVLTSSAAGYEAVNPSNDSVFVFQGEFFGENETAEYDSSGNLNSQFGKNESGAIGVNASTGRIYVSPLFGPVSMYGPAVVVPDVTVTAATQGEQFTATLHGEVDPAGGGEVESCRFEYVTQAHFEAEGFEAAEEAPCSPATPYAGVTEVSASLSALQPDTTYHFRLAANNSNGVVSYSSELTFETPVMTVTGQATNVAATSATFNGTVNPNGTTITDCHFDYGTTTAYGEEAPCASTPSGSSPVPVSADVTGLAENTTYHFRLVAAYSGGSDPGSDETFTTLSRPLIDNAYTSNLTSSSVDLNAEINPMGFDTTYRFEWGTSTSYGNSVPVPDEDIGSGTSDVLASQHVSGLSANTTYHWRVVATNSIGTRTGEDRTFIYDTATPSGTGCPNAQLRANFSSFLPDCRAYEQVSPVDKNDGDVAETFHGNPPQQASVDGERIFYESYTPFAGAQPGTRTQYISSRGAGGWSTQAVSLTRDNTHGGPPGYDNYSLPFSSDLSSGVLRHSEPPLVAGAPGPYIANLYVGHPLADSYELVTDVNPPTRSGGGFVAYFQGASTDFSHVIFTANDALTPEAPPVPPNETGNLYEWVEGQLRLVGLIPTSGTSCTDAECTPVYGAHPGGWNGGAEFTAHAISADGSRIAFQTGPSFNHHIYDRLNGTTTVDVSASQRTPSLGSPDALYQDASVDGSHVLFTSAGALTDDAVPGSGKNLYDYDVETGQLTDLTAADDARFRLIAGLSEDASHVYFVAEGVLAANANSHGDTAVPGQPNLYLWNNGQTTFIATTYIEEYPEYQPTRVTPDGAHLAFDSKASLTGYDNTSVNGTNCGFNNGSEIPPNCSEAYLYDAEANRLICVSCNPSGARPTGLSSLRWSYSPLYRPRNLTPDGSRLFFTSADALLPSDTNGLYDVYEWEAEGSGSCHSSADNGGCLYLISSGRGASGSYFTDASPSGTDAFFQTGNRLIGQDQDDYADLYDARVGGGFPEPPPPAPCEGESCRGEGSHAPVAVGAGTAVFQGPGNPTPKHCRKGFVLRHGKCVKKKHHHKRRRRASAKTGARK
ncbi:MAG TPA: hypothetical protein VF009_07460 [Solirubrobacterales bacterium]